MKLHLELGVFTYYLTKYNYLENKFSCPYFK